MVSVKNEEYWKEYNRNNAKEWAAAHPEQRYETNKKWAEANAEKVKKSQKKYEQNNKEKVKESKRQWKKRNPGAVMLEVEKRRARIICAPGNGVSIDEWKHAMQEYSYRCVYCGKKGALTMDHVVPLIKGGAHDPSNIVPSCMACNVAKHTKDLIIFIYERGLNGIQAAL